MLIKSIVNRSLLTTLTFAYQLNRKAVTLAFEGNFREAKETINKLSKQFNVNPKVIIQRFELSPRAFLKDSQQNQVFKNRFNELKEVEAKGGVRGAIAKITRDKYISSTWVAFAFPNDKFEELMVTCEKYFNEEQAKRIFETCPNMLNPKFTQILQEKFNILRDYLSVKDEEIAEIIGNNPFILAGSTRQFRESIVTFIDIYKMPRQKIIQLMKKHGEVFLLGGPNLKRHYDLPRKWGLYQQQVNRLFLNHPILFYNYPFNMAIFKRRILKYMNFTAKMGRYLLLKHPYVLIWSVRSLQEKALFLLNRLELQINQQSIQVLGFNFNRTLRPRGEILIRSKTAYSNDNLVELMKLTDEQFCEKTGITLERLRQEQQKYPITQQLDFRTGKLLDKRGMKQKLIKLSEQYKR